MRWLALFAALTGCNLETPESTLFNNPQDHGQLAMAEAMATDYLSQIRIPGEGSAEIRDLKISKTEIDTLNMAHVKFQQTFQGVPVVGGELIVHFYPNGAVRKITDNTVKSLKTSTSPLYTEEEAIDFALAERGGDHLSAPPMAQLQIFSFQGQTHLVWRIDLEELGSSPNPAKPVYFIDAITGDTVFTYNNLQTVSTTGQSTFYGNVEIDAYQGAQGYVLEDVGRDFGTMSREGTWGQLYYVTDTDGIFSDATDKDGVDCHFGGSNTLDYWLNVHHRDGLNGAGGPDIANSVTGGGKVIACYVEDGSAPGNAYWNGANINMGLGMSTQDIVGHEMTHGVIQFTANLYYWGEPGAMNESLADVFGEMVEEDVFGPGNHVWEQGEDLIGMAPFRYLYNPTLDGISINHYSDYPAWIDDVHYNSGIGNQQYYLLSEGGDHPTYGGTAMTGVGTEIAEQIVYRALSLYMTSSSGFSDTREAQIAAAEDLYGVGSFEAGEVDASWSLVGVGPAQPPDCSAFAQTITGNLSGPGDFDGQPNGTFYSTTQAGTHHAYLLGPGGADFDLVLYQKINGKWTRVAESVSSDAEEEVNYYANNAGDFVWKVYDFSGSGDYTFCLSNPS